MAESALACRGLTFSYAQDRPPVFSGLSLQVETGEAVLLMGPSGCGKSTLAYCLAGLYPDHAGILTGTVEAEGVPLRDCPIPQRAQRVSILFQNPDNQFCMGRVDQEVLFTLENIHCQGDLQAKMQSLLAQVGLSPLERAPIHTLSGGTKQKLALATALAAGARTLILDEPFANLDPLSCAQLAALLLRLQRQGVTLLIVDHHIHWYRALRPRILLMDRGGRLDPAGILPEELPTRQGELLRLGLFVGEEYPCVPPPPPAAEAPVMAEAQSLRLCYGKKTAAGPLSFTVPAGGVTALIGPCGAGKSTLLAALAGVGRYTGTLRLAGKAGLVFQNPRFQFLALTVEEEVLTTLRPLRPKGTDLSAEAASLLEEFDLLSQRHASPYAISQGQQRRLALLSMLAGDRPLLLLDEPTYAQDHRATAQILKLLARRVAQGLTVVMATHDLRLAQCFASQVLLMEGGTLRPLDPEALSDYIEERRRAYAAAESGL